jgi:hypothetical protein
MKPPSPLGWGAGIGVALGVLAALAVADPSACRQHGGVAGCDPSGQPVCKDGALDKQFTCSNVAFHKKSKRVLKFKKPPNHGQILKPGESPPPETLEQSHKEMRQ